MAFEDRSSPTTAASPSSETTLNCHTLPNSPESTRTSPYTCTTIPYINDNSKYPPLSTLSMMSSNEKYLTPKSDIERNFFRITSYALSSQLENKQSLENDTSSISSCNTTNSNQKCEGRLSPLSSDDNESRDTIDYQDNKIEEPTIQQLKYSIRNILQPDFGKNALVQKCIINKRISFKPYEEQPTKKTKAKKNDTVVSTFHSQESSSTIAASSNQECSTASEDCNKSEENKLPTLWPAWVYCTRYSDRPSSGPRSRRSKKIEKAVEEKRPRTAFSGAQLARLKQEFAENRYLTEKRRQQLSQELGLNEAQIKIWFQNKRAKIKKSSGQKNALAIQLMAQGLYNHTTVPCDEDDMPLSP